MIKLAPYVYDPDFDAETIPRKPNIYYEDVYQNEPLLNPHGDRILRLFQIGKKGVADLDGYSVEYQELKPYIDDQQLHVLTWDDGFSDNRKIIYRPELINDAQELLVLFLENQKQMEQHVPISLQKHRRIGEILGYSTKSINYFCDNVIKNKKPKLI